MHPRERTHARASPRRHAGLLLALALLPGCPDVPIAKTPLDAVATAKETLMLADGRREDVFQYDAFETRARVDVLFIDDNSDSMRDAQQRLGTKLSDFLTSLAKIDWQIGITTTDVTDGTWGLQGSLLPFAAVHQRYLTTGMPNAAQLFAGTIVREETWNCGTDCPSTDERGLRATIEAIGKRDGDNAGFFRDDADLVVIVLSDEDEGSVGGPDVDHGADVVKAFTDAFGAQKALTGFAIIVQPGDTACFKEHETLGGHYGQLLGDFATLTGGTTGSICAPDYGPTLASIGKRVRDGIKVAVLTATPQQDSLELIATPPDPTLTWTLDGRTLRFNHAPLGGTQVVVKYKIAG